MRWRWLLVTVHAMMVRTGSAMDASVSSFPELETAVNAGALSIAVAASITFSRELEMRESLSIDGAMGSSLSGAGSVRLFLVNASRLSLRSIELAHGRHQRAGGAICVIFGELVLHSVTLSHNSAFYGGAVGAFERSTVFMSGCAIRFNSASWGGAVSVSGDSNFTAHGSTLSHNCIGSSETGGGGFAYVQDTSLFAVSSCTMAANSAKHGGVLFASGSSTAIIENCTASSNHAWESGAVIGAFGTTTATVTACTMTSNAAQAHGGVINANQESTINIASCAMVLNSAMYGGALNAAERSTISTKACTMTENTAWFGGALSASDSANAFIAECLLTLNLAAGGGGAVHHDGNLHEEWRHYNSVVAISDCTMTTNSAYYGGAVYIHSFAMTMMHNSTIISNSAGAGGAFRIDDGANLTATDCLFLLNRATNRDSMNTKNGGGVGHVGGSGFSAKLWRDCFDKNPVRCSGHRGPYGFRLGSEPTVVVMNCTFSTNSAITHGGVVKILGFSTFITINCSFSSNSAAGAGGVVAASHASMITAMDSTMTENSASSGGVIHMDLYSIVAFKNCSMFFNTAYSDGGAVTTTGNATVTATRSAMASNVASQVSNGDHDGWSFC